MQEDTYRGAGLNLYAYCQNNPVRYYDPSGYMPLCPYVPNPNGKKGGQPHQNTINSIQPSTTGGEMDYELKYDTPGGSKNYRYADAVEITDGMVTSIHQVGKVNRNGMPVVRESRAIADIMSSPSYNGAPIYFWPYNSNSGPIIYEY